MKKLIEQKLAIELLGTSPDGIIMFDPAGNILYLNQIAAKKYSQDEDELIGTNVWDLYPEAQVAHRKTVVNKVISTGKAIQFTDRDKDQWVDVRIFPIKDEIHGFEGVVTYTHNITRQIVAEEQLKLVSLQLLTNQEDERRRIAQDLHDDIGQSMTALLLKLKTISDDSVDCCSEIEVQIDETIRIVEEMMRHIRQVLYEIRPPSFEKMSLAKALEELCSSLALSTKLHVIFSSQEQLPSLSNTQATVFYRLVQEGMNNAVKHAQATSVWINLEHVDSEVNISFEDDGQGFDPRKRTGYGIGLQGLRERFQMLKGSFEIESAPGKGTRLFGSLPIVINNDNNPS